MLLKKLKIDIDHIKKRNKELIDMKFMDTLSVKQKKFLNWRKGPPRIMNTDGLFGYFDLSNYLTDQNNFNEISVNNFKEYLIIYNIKQKFDFIDFYNINIDLKRLLLEIQTKRIRAIQKYIKIEDSLFEKGIHSNDIIYRMQEKQIEGNIIKNSSSWSLAPIDGFCGNHQCHLYITKIPKNIKVIYIENDSNDKHLTMFQWFNNYEFEYILPRDIEFTEVLTKKIKIPNKYFSNKNETMNKSNDRIFYLHWIKIIKKIKSEFPKIKPIKLVAD